MLYFWTFKKVIFYKFYFHYKLLGLIKKNNEKVLIYKIIDNKISIEDSFEISNNEMTIDLECQSSCGLNISKLKE